MWWSHDAGWPGWLMMTVGMGGFWLLVVVVVVLALRPGHLGPAAPDPLDVLRQRLARGEIDVAEFEARRDALHHRPRTPQ